MDNKMKVFTPPKVECWGNVHNLTAVGTTNPGDDTLPEGAQGRDEGSVSPSG